MGKAKEKELKSKYEEVCQEYLKAFVKLYDIERDVDDVWVANEAGTIACIGDLFLDFHDVIKFSVDNNIGDYDELLRWYDYTLFCADFKMPAPNFSSWMRGCPRMTAEEQGTLITLKKNLDEAIKNFKSKY